MNDVNVSEKLALLKSLDEQRKAIEKEIKSLKAEFEPIVKELDGELVDEIGTITTVEVSGSWSISDAARLVEHATIWSESGNNDIATIGKTVLTFANEKSPYSYLKFKFN